MILYAPCPRDLVITIAQVMIIIMTKFNPCVPWGKAENWLKFIGSNIFFKNFHELRCSKIVHAKHLSSRLKANGHLQYFIFPIHRESWLSGKLLISVKSYCVQWKAIAFSWKLLRSEKLSEEKKEEGKVTTDCYELYYLPLI